jgi:beta-lactamase superfamily II metal-dependent hydrolase
MVFTLEALRAQHGDALLLHYGTAADPRLCIIDGGPGAVYGDALRPRLMEIRGHLEQAGKLRPADPLPVDLIMVSHLDDDHIGGVLGLTGELLQNPQQRPWLTTKTIWNNTFADLADDKEGILLRTQAPSHDAAHVVSVSQGRKLRADAELLGWTANVPFKQLVRAPDKGGHLVKLDADTELLVIAPRSPQITALRKKWRTEMEKIRNRQKTVAEVVEYLDRSPYNLSSIVCLARQKGRTMLLTGDARGDQVLKALDAAGVTEDGAVHVDILKLPHHGSIRNLKADFFRRITADHYVISGNGTHGNPETESLELVTGSRRDDRFAIHLTYDKGAEDLERRIAAFRSSRGRRRYTIAARPAPALSLKIDLADPLVL